MSQERAQKRAISVLESRRQQANNKRTASSQMQVGQKGIKEIEQLMNVSGKVQRDCNQFDCKT